MKPWKRLVTAAMVVCGALPLGCNERGESEAAKTAGNPKIDAAQAIAAATQAVPGSARKVRLGSRRGTPRYEVTVLPSGAASRVRVEVDAMTGQVTKQESGSSKDDDDD